MRQAPGQKPWKLVSDRARNEPYAILRIIFATFSEDTFRSYIVSLPPEASRHLNTLGRKTRNRPKGDSCPLSSN